MITERERFEVLLEEMRDKIDLLADGQAAIRSDMSSMRQEMQQMHSSLKNEMKFTYMALNEKIEDHIKQPSHSA